MSRNDGRQTRRDLLASVLALAGAATVGSLEAGAQSPTGKRPGKDDLAGFQVFPADNPWNQDVLKSKVDPRSDALLQSVGLDKPLHPDFGTVYNNVPNGIPYVVVPGTQPKVPVSFRYADESDPGPYPIPPDAPIEGGPNGEGDRHILLVDRDHAKLYELFSARPKPGGGWSAGSGAIFDLKTGAMRPKGWTSADAAGLPVFPGLARYDEVVVRKAARPAVHGEEVAPGLCPPRSALRQPAHRSEPAADGDAGSAQGVV
jgi:hypothetical protein